MTIRVECAGCVTIIKVEQPQGCNAVIAYAQTPFYPKHDWQTFMPRRPQDLTRGGGRFTTSLDLDRTLIATINGAAIGGGLKTTLDCDIIVSSRNARVALPMVTLALGSGTRKRRSARVECDRFAARHCLGRPSVVVRHEDVRGTRSAARCARATGAAGQWAARAIRSGAFRKAIEPFGGANADRWTLPTVAHMQSSADACVGPDAFLA